MQPLQTILYPTDFSERSRDAFPLACSLAKDHDARLVILYVEPPIVATGYDETFVRPVLAPDYKKQLETNLRQYKALDPNLRVEYRLEAGFASDEILRIAREAPANLIVMGTHGRTGLGRLLMGSVAEQVVRKAPCPVLTVKAPFAEAKPDSAAPIRTILHPTDFSKSARLAFRLACALARDHQARLVVLHVGGAEHADLYGGVPVVQQLEAHARELEEKLHRLKSRHFKIPIERRMEKGIPAERILQVAEQITCDLIVMGCHGRTGLGRLLMGSVAEEVLRKAPCPVLTVKTPLPAGAGSAAPEDVAGQQHGGLTESSKG